MEKSEDSSARSKAENYIATCKAEKKKYDKEATDRERKAFAGVFEKL